MLMQNFMGMQKNSGIESISGVMEEPLIHREIQAITSGSKTKSEHFWRY